MKFGVGIIDGVRIDSGINAHRNLYLRGKLVFDKSLDTGFEFACASGLSGRYYSVPFGTYKLAAQGVGWIIENLYRRFDIDHHPGYDTVWNIGQPGDETCAGYDPAIRRDRHELQMHCEPRLVSQGCVVLGKADFHVFADAMKALQKRHKLALVVSPSEPTFRIVPYDD